MAATEDSRVLAAAREELLIELSASDGNNTTIAHNLGVIPISVQITPTGDGSETANLVSKSASNIVVKISSGGGAMIAIRAGGA